VAHQSADHLLYRSALEDVNISVSMFSVQQLRSSTGSMLQRSWPGQTVLVVACTADAELDL